MWIVLVNEARTPSLARRRPRQTLQRATQKGKQRPQQRLQTRINHRNKLVLTRCARCFVARARWALSTARTTRSRLRQFSERKVRQASYLLQLLLHQKLLWKTLRVIQRLLPSTIHRI